MAGIDIAAITKSAAATAMVLAGTAKVSATINLAKTNTYDPVTDTMTASGGTTKTIEGIFYRPKQSQREATGYEAMFLIEGVNAPSVDEGDTIAIDGATWQIAGIEGVPGKAIIIIGLRK